MDVRETDKMLTFSERSIADSFKFPSDSHLNFLVLKLGREKKMSCHVSGENLAISKYCVIMREGQGLALGNIIYQVQKAKFHGTITITVLEITKYGDV